MRILTKIIYFYRTPFVIIQLLNVFYFIIFGSFLEEYEGFFSTAIEGIYTKPAKLGWDSDTHFLLIYLYSWLANFTKDFNIYGLILFIYNWSSLTFLGFVLYRILKINLSKKSLLLFVLLYSIFCVDNMLNLNSVRHAFIFTAAVLGYIESRRLENKLISNIEWIGLCFILIYAALIRFDAVLLFSIINVVLLLIHKRFYKLALIPVLISASVFIGFNITSAIFSGKEKKVLIYKEREIFDRYNIDYNRLSPLQQLDVDAIMQYCITDKEHFSIEFYDDISRKNSNKGALSLLNGFNLDSYKNAWRISLGNYYVARYFFLFYCLSGFFLLFEKSTNRRRYIIQYLFLGLFPLLLCFYSVVPLRFLIPFLSVAGCLNVFLYSANNDKNKIIAGCSLFVLLFIFFETNKSKKVYQEKAIKYSKFSSKLLRLSQQQTNPIIINSVFPVNYFPVETLGKLPKQHVVFLNFYLFSADDYQIKTWKELCHCNTFSLKERVDYIVATQNLFLIDTAAYNFMSKYFIEKYHIQLQQENLIDFDGNLNVCTLHYSEKTN